jgi:tRNA nucleotidyltransferase (CCA-adding enzyme)
MLLWTSGAKRVRDRVERYLTHLAAVKPALTGRDLTRFGFPPGPKYRRMLDRLLQERLEGRLNSREDEVAFLRRHFGRPR